MSPGTLLAILAALLFAGALPVWPWSRGFSQRPAIASGVVLAAILIFIAIGAV